MDDNMLNLLLTAAGFLGVALVLLAFFLLQRGVFKAESRGYAVMNISGSCGILLSLIVAFNWPSLVIQVCWIAISLYGLARRGMLSSRASK